MPGKAIVAATDAMVTTAPPRPAGPPVTRALRPVKSYTLMWHLLLETAPAAPCAGCLLGFLPGPWLLAGPCDVGHSVTKSGQSSRLSWTIVKFVLGGAGCPIYS